MGKRERLSTAVTDLVGQLVERASELSSGKKGANSDVKVDLNGERVRSFRVISPDLRGRGCSETMEVEVRLVGISVDLLEIVGGPSACSMDKEAGAELVRSLLDPAKDGDG